MTGCIRGVITVPDILVGFIVEHLHATFLGVGVNVGHVL